MSMLALWWKVPLSIVVYPQISWIPMTSSILLRHPHTTAFHSRKLIEEFFWKNRMVRFLTLISTWRLQFLRYHLQTEEAPTLSPDNIFHMIFFLKKKLTSFNPAYWKFDNFSLLAYNQFSLIPRLHGHLLKYYCSTRDLVRDADNIVCFKRFGVSHHNFYIM